MGLHGLGEHVMPAVHVLPSDVQGMGIWRVQTASLVQQTPMGCGQGLGVQTVAGVQVSVCGQFCCNRSEQVPS